MIVDIKSESKTLILVNTYAPNNDDPSFSQNAFTRLLTFECEEIILGGDFNLVLDAQKTKKRREPRNVKNLCKKLSILLKGRHLAWF